jgi:RNA recognition motif-containing protein
MGSIVTPFQKWKEPQWQLPILQLLNSPGLESQRNSKPAFGNFDLGSAVNKTSHSESTSIPKNPRTDRPVGYAFVDLSTPSEAERAIAELSGKEILDRKVSVQLARKPEPAGEKGEGVTSGGEGVSGGEGGRRRPSGRGRGRGRGRGGRGGRAARGVSLRSPEQHS